MNIKIKRIRSEVPLPNITHDGDAGFDVCAAEDCMLAPAVQTSVPTGLAFAIPHEYVALVWDRSGMAIKHGIKTLGGVIDAGFRGEVRIGLINLTDAPYEIRKGDRIAQVLIQKVEYPTFEEVDTLDETARGAQGFGSTGR